MYQQRHQITGRASDAPFRILRRLLQLPPKPPEHPGIKEAVLPHVQLAEVEGGGKGRYTHDWRGKSVRGWYLGRVHRVQLVWDVR
jgi:hypothetical protein